MALFFDQRWFATRLEAFGLTRADLARAAGLTREELDDVWKDQREISAAEVAAMAALLGVEPAEMANRCGVSTPVPGQNKDAMAEIADLRRRVELLEAAVTALKTGQKS